MWREARIRISGGRRGWLASSTFLLLALTAQPPAAQYVDPAACAACHQTIAQTYSQTAMGRSFSLPAGSLNGTYYHQPSDSYFTMLERGGSYFQRRHQLDPAGREINVLEKRIDYIMGSGTHARAFLHRTARNTLIELPLAWYAEKGGYWAMNPGYDTSEHEGFRRKIAYDCMYCHNGYPQLTDAQQQSYAEPVYPATIPQGIDCQRCHGPGSRHVQAARAGAPAASIRQAIVNPARLSPERGEEVCMQCHLETTSFALPNSIQRYGKGPFAYQPGESLADHWLFFDHAPAAGREDKFELVNAVYRIRQSKCYLESGAKLQCTTCHNPHDIPRGAKAEQHYDAVCRQCHSATLDRLVTAGKHTAASGCAACHMPKRRSEDVVHAVVTDHKIQRHKPAGDLLADFAERHESGPTAYKGEVALYYPAKLPLTPESELYLALAQVVQKSNLAAGAPRLARAIERAQPSRPEFYYELAEAWSNSGQLDKAIPAYREAVRRNPKSALSLWKLGSALRTTGQTAEAVAILKNAVAAAPNDAAARHELGLAYRAQSNTPEAVAALQKAIALDPDAPEFPNNLGIVWSAAGDSQKAEVAFAEAIRLQPGNVDAHNNLANLLSAAGNFEQARRHFEAALKLRPTDSTTRYNFAMALGRARQYDDAQRQLEAAVQADPVHTDARQRLAEMLIARGQPALALPHYRELVRRQPESEPALLGLGASLAMSGDVPAAIPYLKRAAAAKDPEIREQAQQILRQIGERP